MRQLRTNLKAPANKYLMNAHPENTGAINAESQAALERRLAELVERDVSLRPYCSFGVGGAADMFVVARTNAQMSELLSLASRLGLPRAVIGSGTNLLISDKGFRGLVIKNEIMGLEVSGGRITIGAGEDYMALVNAATAAGLSGMEFAAGIWGTVGGAVTGNAGAYGSEICDVMVEAEIASPEGRISVQPTAYFEFAYRDSRLKRSGEVVLNATVELKSGDSNEIQARVDEILAIRAEKHPRIPNSAGSFFKNIPDPSQPHGKLPAGKLLDEVGARGLVCGGAQVFEKHANILINTGQASSQDIRELADMLKEKARQRHGITLEEEVVSLGEFD